MQHITTRRRIRAAATVALSGAMIAALARVLVGRIELVHRAACRRPRRRPPPRPPTFGGMKGLVAAANAEGHLNVITLPPSWANYGKIIAGFEKKYPKIKINSQNPNGSSADEVSAAKAQKGRQQRPRRLRHRHRGARARTSTSSRRTRCANWADIPADFKDPSGKWYYDYTGLMSIGYDSSKVQAPDDHDGPARAGVQGQGRHQG